MGKDTVLMPIVLQFTDWAIKAEEMEAESRKRTEGALLILEQVPLPLPLIGCSLLSCPVRDAPLHAAPALPASAPRWSPLCWRTSGAE